MNEAVSEFVAADRAILKIADPDDAKAKTTAVVKVVNEWMKATA